MLPTSAKSKFEAKEQEYDDNHITLDSDVLKYSKEFQLASLFDLYINEGSPVLEGATYLILQKLQGFTYH